MVKEFGSENLELLKQEDAYPYKYKNSFERFNEKKLPARKYFYSSTNNGKIGDHGKISDSHISLKDYLTCEKIWDSFNIKNVGDYHDHYLKKDALFLADVFKKFIDTCLKLYSLAPCNYFSSPRLSSDAMLKMIGIKLEKISGIDKYLFIEKAVKRGITYITKRYAKANNNSMNDYDPKKPSTFMTDLDMNNLYDWAMNEYLLSGGFKWLKNVDEFDVMSSVKRIQQDIFSTLIIIIH